MCRAVALATASPWWRATTRRAMSIPAEMPAEVRTPPSSTTCSSSTTVTAGNHARISPRTRQCVVARLPSSRPALPRSSEPVQTEASVGTARPRSATQAISASFAISRRVPQPPGTTSTSSGGQSSGV